MKKNYSLKDCEEFWKRKNKSDEQRRLRDIRLPFKKKIPIIEELMEQAIFFLDLQQKRRGSTL